MQSLEWFIIAIVVVLLAIVCAFFINVSAGATAGTLPARVAPTNLAMLVPGTLNLEFGVPDNSVPTAPTYPMLSASGDNSCELTP